MYGTLNNFLAKKNRPADDNYDDGLTYGPHFKQKIDASIIKIRDKLLAEYNYNKDLLAKRNQPLYDKNVFWKLIYSPELHNINPNQIITTHLFECKSYEIHIDNQDREDINRIIQEKEACDPAIIYKQTESLVGTAKEAKSYLLAKKLGRTEEAKIIQDAAIDTAKKGLLISLEGYESRTKPLCLIYATKYLALFDLNDILKNEINVFIDTLINENVPSNPTEWNDFLKIIQVVKGFNQLTPDLITKAQDTVIKFSKQFIECYTNTLSSDETEFGLPEFLEMARTVQLPEAKQKEIYLAYLNKHTLDYSNESLHHLPRKLVPLVYQEEIFKKTVEAIATGDDFEMRIKQFLRGFSTWSTRIVDEIIQKKKSAGHHTTVPTPSISQTHVHVEKVAEKKTTKSSEKISYIYKCLSYLGLWKESPAANKIDRDMFKEQQTPTSSLI